MRIFSSMLICSVMLATCALSAQAQTRRQQPVRRAGPVLPRPLKPSWTIVEEHLGEDNDNATLYRLEPVPLTMATPVRGQAFLTASITVTGQPPAAPKFVALTFLSTATACRFPPQSNLILVLDGRTITLNYQTQSPQGEGVWWVSQDTESGGCGESLGAFVSPQSFRRIAAAQAGTAKIGTIVFKLTGTPLDALRDLATRLP